MTSPLKPMGPSEIADLPPLHRILNYDEWLQAQQLSHEAIQARPFPVLTPIPKGYAELSDGNPIPKPGAGEANKPEGIGQGVQNLSEGLHALAGAAIERIKELRHGYTVGQAAHDVYDNTLKIIKEGVDEGDAGKVILGVVPLLTAGAAGVKALTGRAAATEALAAGTEFRAAGPVNPFGEGARPPETAVSDVRPTAELTPLAGTGELKTRGLSAHIEEQAVAKGLAESLGDLPQYRTLNFADQAQRASALVSDDPALAYKVALGQEVAPAGVLPEAVAIAVEKAAQKAKDVDALRAIAQGPIAQRETTMGQSISILQTRNADSPVSAMRRVKELRGVDVTPEEATRITELSTAIEDARATLPPDKTIMEPGWDERAFEERMKYGRAKDELRRYVSDLTSDATRPGIVRNVLGLTKALKSTLDDSFIGRQGAKTFWTNNEIWRKNALQSFVDIADTFGGKAVLDETSAEISSRANAILGRYKTGGLSAGASEEAYPPNVLEKIPGFGTAYKATEAGFTAQAWRTRADVFDKYLSIAEKIGLNPDDPALLADIGSLANSLGSRANLGAAEKYADAVNLTLFSGRKLKSDWDVLTGHTFGRGLETPFARKIAAQNVLKVVGGTAAVMILADQLEPGSVTFDPNSSDFGQIKIGNTRFDLSGGMRWLPTLSARLAGHVVKSVGQLAGMDAKKLTPKYGQSSGVDVAMRTLRGKASPAAGFVWDLLAQKDFKGDPLTLGGELSNLFEPLPTANIRQVLSDPKTTPELAAAAILADALGIGTNTYQPKGKKEPTKGGIAKPYVPK